jgi:BirA family biotin operon repressor/biotin-[acetyl-CoA-carboxylase] ligase
MTDGARAVASGFVVHAYSEVGSTNDVARELLRLGAPARVVVHARAQTKGRGRDGRSWISAPGDLYLSIGLRPRGRPGDVALLGFATAVAVAETVDAFAGAAGPARIKWPNDVLLAGRKIAGILLESDGARPDGVDALVVGVGINVGGDPAGTRIPATSLRLAGANAGVDEVLEAFLACFDRHYRAWEDEGFAPVRTAWLARAHGLGDPVVARLPGATLEGRFAGLGPDGALLLDQGGGAVRHIHAGDVFFPASAC